MTRKPAFAAAIALAGCGGGESEPGPARSAAAPLGLTVWTAQGCGSCHSFEAASARGEIGPNLDAALATRTREQITAAIVAPGSGSMMPRDFGARLSATELRDLTDFLATSATGGSTEEGT